MSIEITAVGKPQKLFGGEKTLPDMAGALIRLVGAGRVSTGASHGQGSLRVRLCPGMALEFWPGRGSWHMGCSVGLAGPGAHAALMSLLDVLGNELQMHWQVEDPSGYARKRDFSVLRHWHIRQLQQLSRAMDSAENVNQRPVRFLFWPVGMDAYPVFEQGVVTPMGWFANGELAARAWQDPEALALDLFVWPNEETDGWYWRNQALFALWNRVFWVPGETEPEKSAQREALSWLEKAARTDERLPLPRLEYEQLCALQGCRPMDWHNPPMDTATEIGFRKQDYRHTLPPWSVVCDGALVEAQRNREQLVLRRGECTVSVRSVEGDLPPQEGATFTLENPGTAYAGRYEAGEGHCRLLATAHARNAHAGAKIEITWPNQTDDGWARMLLMQVRHEL